MEFTGASGASGASTFSKYLIGIRDGDSVLLKECIPMEITGKLKGSNALGKRIQKVILF